MKRFLFFIVAAIFCNLVRAQSGNPIVYSDVVTVENVSAEELFARAQVWAAKAYNNSKHVIQVADNNRLVGKAKFIFDHWMGFVFGQGYGHLDYTLTIECRDGRYKYTIDDIQFTLDISQKQSDVYFGVLTDAEKLEKENVWKARLTLKQRQTAWEAAKENMDAYATGLIASLMIDMSKIAENNDW